MRKALKKIGYETVFLTAPVKVETADLPFDINVKSLGGSEGGGSDEESSMRSWWPNSESSPNYYKLDQAFKAVTDSISEHGPYDGVLGFSQGAGFAGVLCKHIQNLHQSQPPLRFAILYAGFRLKPQEHQHYYDTEITTPTLHIVGSLDTVVSEERTNALFEVCDESKRTFLSHPGGHFVPNGKDMVTKLIGWVQNLDVQETQNAKPADEETWDEFDKIGA